jgi:hypothetical protein
MIKRRAVTIVPITKTIIDLVHAMATNDKMPDGIKIETNSGMTIYDSSWIAGVDYDNDDEKTENDSAYNDGDDNSAESEEEENFDEMDPNKIAKLIQEDVVNNEDNRPNNEEIEAENNENNQNHPNVAENNENNQIIQMSQKMRIQKKKLKKTLKKKKEKEKEKKIMTPIQAEMKKAKTKVKTSSNHLKQHVQDEQSNPLNVIIYIRKVIKKPNTASKLQRSLQKL